MSERIEFQPDEKIISKLRKHWIILLRDTVGTILLGILPFLILVLADSVPSLQEIIGGNSAALNFGVLVWFFVAWIAFVVLWTNYYLDIWIVTDRRIINIDQIGIFDRKVATWRMERIQEITVSTRNFMQSLFNYGSIEIQTAGPTDEYATIEGIPDPERVRSAILEQVDSFSERHNNENHGNVAANHDTHSE